MDARFLVATLLVAMTGTLFAYSLITTDSDRVRNASDGAAPLEEGVQRTADGTKYLIHPDELLRGCSGLDCIPSIDDPAFTDAAAADEWLRPGNLVIGIDHNGEEKAYPLAILNLHEIVNDEVGGDSLAVTYCPLCRSGVTYDRRVGGEVLEFGVSGKLYNANLIMYDRQTESYWSQIGGEAVVGPMVPAELEIVHSSITTWNDWKDGHPDTVVLSRDTGVYPTSYYDRNPYSGYETRQDVGFGVIEVDDRLHSKALIWGVAIGSESVAYPDELLREQGSVSDVIGDVPVFVFEHPSDSSVQVIIREVDGAPVNLTVSGTELVADDGRTWMLDGTATDADTDLERAPAHGFFWFAWVKFHPETTVYAPAGQ